MPPRFWLCLSVLLPYSLDVLLTLVSQPSGYWAGDRLQVRESNPLAAWLLQVHPGCFVGVTAGWGLLLGLGAWVAPLRLALPLGFVLAVAHSLGAGSWLVGEGTWGLLSAVALLVVVERLMAATWKRLHPGEGRTPRGR
jgi:hypothetical protein